METANSSTSISELEKLISSLEEDKRLRIFFALDYVLHYFTGDRRISKLSELGFADEIDRLRNIEIVKETPVYWRGNRYSRFFLEREIENRVNSLLREEYYPMLNEGSMSAKLRETAKRSLSAASKLWHKVIEFEGRQYTLSGYGEYESEVIELGKQLSLIGLGFPIGYRTSSWGDYLGDFVFRTEPIDARGVFLKVVEEEINDVFTSFTPAARWCTYLKFFRPDADEKFMLRNATSRFLPQEIREAFFKLPILKVEKFKQVLEPLLSKERDRLSSVIRSLLVRDNTTVQVLETLLMISEDKEKCVQVSQWHLGKFKELFASAHETLTNYIKILEDHGLVLQSEYDGILIPKMVLEVLSDQIRGAAAELKIFESPLDAQAFIEEKMSRATSTVRIWDPYVSTKTLMMIERSVEPDRVLVAILSSQPTVIDEIINLGKKGIRIKVNMVYRKEGDRYLSPFHDRYLAIDIAHVWHFGPSLHGAGEKESESASLFPERFAKMIIDAFEYNFGKRIEAWKKDGYQVIIKDLSGQS